jgi:hypothetical protein
MSLLLALASGAAPELLGGGSFSLVGNEATIRIGRRIVADTQTYTEDLKPANLLIGRKISSALGYYTINTWARVTDFSDNFNRADESLDANANWERADLEVGSLSIVSNSVTGVDVGNVYSTALSDNQWAEFTFSGLFSSATGKGAALLLRATGNSSSFTGYAVTIERENSEPNTDLVQIRRVLGSTNYANALQLGALLASYRIPEFSSGGNVLLRAEILGSRIYVYVNNIYIFTVNSTSITSGKAGIWADSAVIDDFSCGSFEDTLSFKVDRRIAADSQTYNEDLKPANLYKSITAPTDIAQGIKGWFDASNRSSLTVSSNNLTVWNDLSGQNDHLDTIQGNNPKSGLRTISGKNAIEFNNDGAIYDFDNTGGTTAPNATIAMVFVADATDGTIVSSRTTLDTKIRLDSSSKLVMYGGSANQAASTRNITTSQIYTAIGIFTGTTSKLWINGVSEDMSISSEDRILIAMIGAGGAGDTDYFDGLVGEVAIYENALSDSEALSLHSYLYKKWVLDKTILSDTSSYTLTGNTAGTLYGRKLVADTRSYSLVGNDVTLTKAGGAKIITADTQSYSISGSANLIVSRKLLADVQTYNENLQPANLLVGKKLFADVQTYNENLQSANLIVARKLSAAVQTYNENLQPANLLASRKLLAAVQSYNEDLKPANLTLARKLLAAVQSYSEDLKPANLIVARKLLADVQTYNETLQSANLLAGKKLFADVQTYNENLQPANLFVGRRLTADVRSYALDGKPATFPLTRKLISEKSTYTLIGNSLSFSTLGKITADVRSYSLTGQNVGLRVTRRLVSDTQSYTFIGKDANLKSGRKISANISAYILSGNDAGVLRGRKLTADFSSYTLLGQTANFPLGRRLIANNTNYNLDGKNVNVLYGRKVQLTKYTSTLTGNTANLLAGRKLLSAQTSYNLNTIPASLKYGRKLPISVANYNFTFNQLLFSRGGFIKVWTGTVWASKPLKVWNGTAWVSKPLKVWNGTTWRTF